jgi:uroporphyrinogen-III synthase
MAPYAAAIDAHDLGLEAIALPLMRSVPPPDPLALANALAAGGYAQVIVTSARGAEALVEAASNGAELPDVWAVGDATATALTEAGLVVNLVERGDEFDGAAMARAVVARRSIAGRRILWPRGADARDEAAAVLRDAGAIVDGVIAYAMEPIAADARVMRAGLAALRTGTAAVCAVFAPSHVRALVEHVGTSGSLRAIASRTRFVAIGRTTAAALADAGAELDATAIARAATPEAMAAAVASVYPQQR